MIKVIGFDFGGVLGTESNDYYGDFVEIQKITGLSGNTLIDFFNKHWPLLKIGTESTLDFWKDVAANSIKKVSTKMLESVYISKISIKKDVLNIAINLASGGHYLVLIPNEAKQWMDYKIKKFKLRNIFKKIYCSAYLGIGKPDIKIFKYVLRDLKIKPEELLFIDNQENNIEVANKIGIKAILYRNPKQLREDLRNAI